MSLDDFIKGASVFNAGLQQMAANNALNSAQKKLHEVNMTITDENERLMAASQVSDQLAMQLAASGADASTIQQTAGRFGVSGSAQYNAAFQKESQEKGQQFTAGENAKGRNLERELADLKFDAAEKKAAADLDKEQISLLEDFGAKFEKAASKNLEGASQARIAQDILKRGNPIGDSSLATFMARATGEVGNLTEAERQPFGSSKAITSRMRQIMSEYSSGKMTAENRKYLFDLARTLEEANLRRSSEIRERFAKRAKRLMKLKGQDMDIDQIKNTIYDVTDIGNQAPPQNEAELYTSPAQGAGGIDLNQFVE